MRNTNKYPNISTNKIKKTNMESKDTLQPRKKGGDFSSFEGGEEEKAASQVPN